MGQIIWIMAGAAAVGAVIGLSALSGQDVERAATGPSISDGAAPILYAPRVEPVSTSGQALAAAAFGLSALQPETYDGELVLEIIDASHLGAAEKRELADDLAAAEAGRADLDDVLEDVRIALAVE